MKLTVAFVPAVLLVSSAAVAWPSIPDPVSAAKSAASSSSDKKPASKSEPRAASAPAPAPAGDTGGSAQCIAAARRSEGFVAMKIDPKTDATTAVGYCEAHNTPNLSQCTPEQSASILAACERSILMLTRYGRDYQAGYSGDSRMEVMLKVAPTSPITERTRAQLDTIRKETATVNGLVSSITADCATRAAAETKAATLSEDGRGYYALSISRLSAKNGAQQALDVATRTEAEAKTHEPSEGAFGEPLPHPVLCYADIDAQALAARAKAETARNAALAKDEACLKDKKCKAARLHNENVGAACEALSFKKSAEAELAAEKANMKATGVTRPFVLGKLAGSVKDSTQAYQDAATEYREATGKPFAASMCR